MDATPLRRVGRLVAAKLEDPELELPVATLKKGTRLTMSELAGEIKEPLEAMERAMQELEDLLPLAARSLEEKRQAHVAVDEKSAKLARFLEGLYELEGHDVLAAKVRPSHHRRGDAGDPEKTGAAETPENVQAEGTSEVAPVAPEPVAPEPAVEAVGVDVLPASGVLPPAPEGAQAPGGRRPGADRPRRRTVSRSPSRNLRAATTRQQDAAAR